MSGLTIEDISFIYPNGYVAIENVSFEIQKGENVAIVGQNDAGKTTLVKMLNGLLKPSKGNILIDGKKTSQSSAAQIAKKVGYVFQNPGDQIFNQTVFQEIAYILRYYNLSEDEVNDRVRDAAMICNIVDMLDMNPYELPFSTRKFVTIAVVIAMDCDYIILDEPTAGQDSQGILQLQKIIAYLKEKGKTILTITHDMEFVVNSFNRVMVMANKHKIADGSPQEIFWDFPVMEESALSQPIIAQLGHQIQMEDIVKMEEFLKKYSTKQKNKKLIYL